MNKDSMNDLYFISNKQSKNLNYFWLGFIIYLISYTLFSTTYVSPQVFQGIQLVGLIFIIPATFKLIQLKIDTSYLQLLFVLLCFWTVIIVFRGFLFNYEFLKKMLFDPGFGILPYIAPVFLLFPRNLAFYKKTFEAILIFSIFSVIFDIIFIKDLLSSDHSFNNLPQSIVESISDLSIPASFLLLTYAYHSKKVNLFAAGVMILSLLFSIVRARRSLIFIFSSSILLSYLLFLFTSKGKLLIIYSTILIILLGALYVSSAYKIGDSRIFSFLNERGTEDTRTGVELYFYDDMKPNDWIAGRGINGQYFCPDADQTILTNYRDVVETGYLQIILKGGIINLALLILIAIPAIFKGLFDSKNLLSKAAALWILLRVIYSYPTIVNAYTMPYLLFWISIGICYSKEIRNIPEKSVKEYFKSFQK